MTPQEKGLTVLATPLVGIQAPKLGIPEQISFYQLYEPARDMSTGYPT